MSTNHRNLIWVLVFNFLLLPLSAQVSIDRLQKEADQLRLDSKFEEATIRYLELAPLYGGTKNWQQLASQVTLSIASVF